MSEVRYRYRWKTPTRTGRWHDTRKDAGDAAVVAGLASRDPHSGILYLDVLTEIEREELRAER
jgi:hypothetical protein